AGAAWPAQGLLDAPSPRFIEPLLEEVERDARVEVSVPVPIPVQRGPPLAARRRGWTFFCPSQREGSRHSSLIPWGSARICSTWPRRRSMHRARVGPRDPTGTPSRWDSSL